MKIVIVLAAILAVAVAVPVDIKDVQIVRYDSDNIGTDSYKYDFETSDGKKHQEEGHLKNVGTDNEALDVHGSFAYVGDDGITYAVNYVADENGFQPSGAHIPK